jgi:enoyl-CoA hydratase
VAGKSAVFGVSEVKLGLFPLGASTVRLRRQIPYTIAADMLLTGRTLSAEEAYRYGLVGYLTEDGQALGKAKDLAERIARNGPVAVQAVLQALRETECLPEEDAFPIEARIGMRVFMSEDAKEGPRAFAEKRKPQFQGR